MFAFIPQTPDQTAILQDGFLTSSRSGTLILPTGGGKSRLAWVAILHAFTQSKKAIYLAPTKAVLEEQYRAWKGQIEQAESQSVEVLDNTPVHPALSLFDWIEPTDDPPSGGRDGTGDVGHAEAGAGTMAEVGGEPSLVCQFELRTPTVGIFDGDHATPVGAYQRTDLLLMTPERLDLCLRHRSVQAEAAWIKSVGLCVIDEAQVLRDGHRGARLEGALTRLRQVNPQCRWLALSADLNPNDHQLLGWIGEYVYYSTARPVPQMWRLITYRNRADQSQQLLRLLRQEPSLSLVFVSSRNRTAQIAQMLNGAGIPTETHHAGRSSEQRHEAEERFRARQLQVLVATSTLATGVNLPARQVVVHDLYKPNGRAIAAGATDWRDRFMPLTTEEVLQMAGRAGRPGLDRQGDVVIMAHERDCWARSLLPQMGQQSAEKPLIPSVFCNQTAWMLEQVLTLISGAYAESIEQVQSVLLETLAARQGLLPDMDKLAEMMVLLAQAGLVVTGERLAVTPLGQACSTQYLMPATAIRWAMTLQQIAETQEQPTFLDWLALLSLPPEVKLLGEGSAFGNPSASYWLVTGTAAVRLHTQTNERLDALYGHAAILKRFTESQGDMARVLEWVDEHSGGSLQVYVADLQAGLDTAVRLIEALIEVVRALSGVALPNAVGKLQVLAQMLKVGLNGETVTLTLLDGVGIKRALALNAIGIRCLDDVATVDATVIASIRGISAKHGTKLVGQARSLQAQIKQEWFND